MKKVLLIGDGAREHALAEALMKSSEGYRIFALSSYRNPGINEVVKLTHGEYYFGNINSREAVRKVINSVNPDFGVIGPEEPLFHGVSDEFRENGIPVVGASSKCSMIERSKVWMRQLMWKYKIPGRLRFRAFSSIDEAMNFIIQKSGSIVIKPAEQAGGKGVKVIADIQRYLSNEKKSAAAKSLKDIGSLAKGEYKILVEERVDGIEYTLHVLTDGKSYIPLPLAQDYKHAYTEGIGPETGGMGSISGPDYLLPFINNEEYEVTLEIVKSTIQAIEKETGEKYIGIIAGQMMLTDLWGPTLIEFYSRMGDPETSAILPRIIDDFGKVLELTATGHINKAKLSVEGVSLVRAVAPLGYPIDRNLASGKEIYVDVNKIREEGCYIYFGSVELSEMRLITKGSRALEIGVISQDYQTALKKIDKCFKYIDANTPLIFRRDIGRDIERMIKKAEIIRYSYQRRIANGTLGVSDEWYEYV